MKYVRASQEKFGEKSLRVLGPKIWNRLLPHVKNAKKLFDFKRLIRTRDGVLCKKLIHV